MTEQHGWSEYMRLVLEQLRTNTDSIKELGTNYHQLRTEIGKIVGDIQLSFHQRVAELKLDAAESLTNKLRAAEDDVERKIQQVSSEFTKKIEELNKEANKKIDDLTKEVNQANRSITALQVKAGVFGMLGSLIGFLLVYLAKLLP